MVNTYQISKEDRNVLFQKAREMSGVAYCPYSKFPVGCCLLVRNEKGEVKFIVGANVENQSYGLTICAERAAVCTSVSQGYRELLACAVVTPVQCACCGACLQVLQEFAVKDMPVYLLHEDTNKPVVETSMSKLLPGAIDIKSVVIQD